MITLFYIYNDQEKNNFECFKNLPPSQANIEQDCDIIWDQANDWANSKEIDISYVGHLVIKIFAKPEFICYRKEDFYTNGWCHTEWNNNDRGWGICSESCKYIKNLVALEADDYLNKVCFI